MGIKEDIELAKYVKELWSEYYRSRNNHDLLDSRLSIKNYILFLEGEDSEILSAKIKLFDSVYSCNGFLTGKKKDVLEKARHHSAMLKKYFTYL